MEYSATVNDQTDTEINIQKANKETLGKIFVVGFLMLFIMSFNKII